MLLFIGCGCALYCCWAWFQYISCYCLSPGNELPNSMWFISIHLMLLFIPSSKPLFPAVQSFQYISCYCLSHKEYEGWYESIKFQYISCYCLSVTSLYSIYVMHISIHLMLLFICGTVTGHDRCHQISIHLMLLFICRMVSNLDNWIYFNTSHVTVYPYWKITSYYLSLISIHLMLLFILAFFHCFSAPSLFQYISCYCLSKDKREPQQVQTDFNTSHVTVYLKINNAFSKFHNISIHLMLLFIIMPESIWALHSWISIHLMLLFIAYPEQRCDRR